MRRDEVVARTLQSLHAEGETAALLKALDESPFEALVPELDRLSPVGEDFGTYTHVLAATAGQTHPAREEARTVIEKYKMFIKGATQDLVTPVGQRFATLVRRIAKLAYELNECASIVFATGRALQLSLPADDHFSPIHADYLAVCVNARMYHLASEMPMPKIINASPWLVGTDVQLFYYYWSLVCISKQDFPAAIQSFRLLFSVPMKTSTDVSVDAYKKLILSSLCLTGQRPTVPRYLSDLVGLKFTRICGTYNELSAAIEKDEIESALEIVSANQEEFVADNNLGLVKQAIAATRRRKFHKLRKTFSTLPISEVTRRISLSSEEETVTLLFEIIRSGEMLAVLDDRKGTAAFQDGETGSIESGAMRDGGVKNLDEQLEYCIQNVQKILEFHEMLKLDKTLITVDVLKEMEREFREKFNRDRSHKKDQPDRKT